MGNRTLAFEIAVSLCLMAMGWVLVQQGLPGYGLVVVAAILLGLSFATRQWIAQPAKVKVLSDHRGGH
ncbi:hypothetical protein [Marinobacterium jannaschii]|uniref:hypothetical protein n=1 Tax=Marinobacterium jannaschii TaxID=64970 RepID=UPI000488FE6B|nr:hypothetical protein [Marinobacterium jannaschii]